MLTVRTIITVVPLSFVLAGLSASAQVPVRPGSQEQVIAPSIPMPSATQLQAAPRARAQQRQVQPPQQPPTAQPQQQQPSNEERRQAARAKGRFQLDFNKADIADVVQTISDFTGKLFIVPENLRGKITIVGPEDGTGLVTADEAYAAFLSALEANNWTVYPVGQYLKLVEKRAAANSNVWTYLDNSTPIPDDERTVTKVIRLNHVNTDTLANPIKQLMSKDATLIPLPPDTMIVTEVSLNLRRIERIIEALDQPGGGEEMRVIQVEYATAAELSEKLLQIFESQDTGGGARGGGRANAPRPAAAQAEGAGGEAAAPSISRVIPDERTNKLIVIANRKAFEQIDTLIRQLDVPTGDTGRINVYYLENANAEDLASTLQSLTTGSSPTAGAARQRRGAQAATPQAAELFSGEVKISADKATNSLVVVASTQDYRNLVQVIERLDIPRRQVFVEAVIMEVNLRDTTDFGFSVHGGGSVETNDGIAPIVVGNQVGSASSLNLSSLVSLGGFLAGIQGPPIGAAAELGVALPSFGVVMHALTKNSDVNVLSTPHILTSDNEEAEITVGQNVPFQAGFAPQGVQNLFNNQSGNAAGGLLGGALGGGFGLGSFFAPIQRQNVELRLKIKPQINESDYIRMTVEEQTEEIAEQDPVLGPTTAKRTAKTVVVAKDQTTVVIGGLIQERTIKSVSKTPILGDIPVLGWLFRDSSTTKAKTNLLLFLTPYIIRDQSDFRRIFERKMREREEFIAAFYGTSTEYEVPIDYARKAGPVAILNRDVGREMQKVENGGPGAPGETRIQPQERGRRDQAPAPRGNDDWHRQEGGPSDWQRPDGAPAETPEEGAPAEPEEAPAERQEAPAEQQEAPAERQEAPAEQQEAPAERQEAPADDRGSEEGNEPQQPTDGDDAGTD